MGMKRFNRERTIKSHLAIGGVLEESERVVRRRVG
jgi:hypothetical protein